MGSPTSFGGQSPHALAPCPPDTRAPCSPCPPPGPDAALFCSHYYVKPGGNCDLSPRSDPHHEFVGLNCLIQRQVGAPRALPPALGSWTKGLGEGCAECGPLVLRHERERPAVRRPAGMHAGGTASAVALPACHPWPLACGTDHALCAAPSSSALGRPLPQSLAETAKAAGKSEEETAELLASCREKLFRAREGRPRPHLDNKVCCACCAVPRCATLRCNIVQRGAMQCSLACTPALPCLYARLLSRAHAALDLSVSRLHCLPRMMRARATPLPSPPPSPSPHPAGCGRLERHGHFCLRPGGARAGSRAASRPPAFPSGGAPKARVPAGGAKGKGA